MPKSTMFLGLAAALAVPPATASVLGPHAEACFGRGPAMLVRVEGLKTRGGTLRVQTYGGDPAAYFEKGTYLERVEVRPTAAGPVDVCMPVPKPGVYAVSVRHDVDDNRKASLADGGGMSGNPNVSLMDVVFKRRPAPSEVQVEVKGIKTVPITLYYVHGTSVGPISGTGR